MELGGVELGDRRDVPQVLIRTKTGERPVCPRFPCPGFLPGNARIPPAWRTTVKG